MKTSNRFINLKFKGILSGLIAVTMLVSSCSKNDNKIVVEGEAKVMVANSASGSQPQDFYLSSTKLTASAVVYNESTSYITTPAGNDLKAEFKNSGSTTANFTGYVNLASGENYTFFYTSTVNGSGNSSAVFKDDKTSPAAGKAKVRFVNLAQGLASANLIVSGGASWASNVAFGTASNYFEVDPGTFTLQTVLSTSISTTANLGSFTLQAGKIYTIYTSGSLTGTASAAITAKMLVHN